MSIGAGGLAQMTYNNSNNGFQLSGLGSPSTGFGGRSRFNTKRLSVALPPNVNAISEEYADNPTPRTSRSHLLAGLRTQPKAPVVPASAPYGQTQHHLHARSGSHHGDSSYNSAYSRNFPQTAAGSTFDAGQQYSMSAGQQMYALPEQVLAPPSMYEQVEEMDPSVLQQMQMTSMFLAQRQQQLQQQLANITAAAQGINLNGNMQRFPLQQAPMALHSPQGFYGQQQVQAPIEVPGQPGVYLVYNPNTQSYSYMVDPAAQQHAQARMTPNQVEQMESFASPNHELSSPNFKVSDAAAERRSPSHVRSQSPSKKPQAPSAMLENVEPLPPPSATAFRRGHKKASSLAIDPLLSTTEGPKTASAAVFGSQRGVFPPTPMTGSFGPGAARAGKHPVRQPRGPPPLEELTLAPTSKHENSKNFATRQRRRALDNLVKAGTQRRGVSRSSDGSPVSEQDFGFPAANDFEDLNSFGAASGRKMSPIGSEMKEKRASQSSNDGYFGLSSASSSEGEDVGVFKLPPTPATPAGTGGDRKKMMMGVLSAAEKRKSFMF